VKINSFLESNHFIISLTQPERSQCWEVYVALLFFWLVPISKQTATFCRQQPETPQRLPVCTGGKLHAFW